MPKISENDFPYVELAEQGSAPDTPASGIVRLYVDTGGIIRRKDDTGDDQAVGGSGGAADHSIVQGRLTLETGVAISTADQSAKATLYFTPFRGNLIGTYTDAEWQVQSFTEKSLSLAALSADTNYDIFIEDSDLSLSAVAWASATARATALTTQDGVLVLTGDVSKRYLGTIRINGTGGQSEDTLTQRFVWNCYHQRPRPMFVADPTDTWSYSTTGVWRAANNTTTNHRLAFVQGLDESAVESWLHTGAEILNSTPTVAIGLDSTTAPSALCARQEVLDTAAATEHVQLTARLLGHVGVGFHELNWIEHVRTSSGGVTFHGDQGVTTTQSALMATVWG